MKMKTVVKSSLFSASKDEIFQKLQKMETLQYIASPFARFIPVDDTQPINWKEGAVFQFDFYLFGIIPFGIHTIHVQHFNKESGVFTRESNKYVPIWNHRIYLESVNDNITYYTDEIEISAGWKTIFVAIWSKIFYAHRQRKWQKLLSGKQLTK